MVRRHAPLVFAVAAVLFLAVAVMERAVKLEIPRAISVVLLAVSMAGLIGTIGAEGTGRVYPLGRDSEDSRPQV
jgi:hypothetical protein